MRAVENLDVEGFFKIALLSGRQLAIEDDGGRVVEQDLSLELFYFAGADQSGGIGTRAGLDYGFGYARTGRERKISELRDGFVGGDLGLIDAGRCSLRGAAR